MGNISSYFSTLGDGWTIYLWLVAGGMIILASIYGIRWAAKNEQFDEDIKYLVFTEESDKERMSPQEYAKSREVIAAQEKSRERVLQQKAEER
ncbi:MAG TPA: hypothetical protein VKG67_00125, partial [Gallionellaceae bacterium]|nr:hypothetical protein [Gallionellaceae bacterium]